MSKCPKCGCAVESRGVYFDGSPAYRLAGTPILHELDGRNCLRNQLAAVTADRDEYREWWETACGHVKESLELLGVDVSVDGDVPDTWTLRQACKIAGDRLREAARDTKRLTVILDRLEQHLALRIEMTEAAEAEGDV